MEQPELDPWQFDTFNIFLVLQTYANSPDFDGLPMGLAMWKITVWLETYSVGPKKFPIQKMTQILEVGGYKHQGDSGEKGNVRCAGT